MIYQININDLPIAITNMCQIVCISNDSQNALIRCSNLENITAIQSFQDDELNSVLQQDYWRQPCTNC
jgi:hypothetical protein